MSIPELLAQIGSQDVNSPSTRESTSLWTKWVNIDKTLAAAGTAENLFSVSSLLPTVNMVTNPSFETGSPPTGFTASGSSLSKVGSNARTSTNCIQIDPDNSASAEGFYWASPSVGGLNNYLVASIYLRRASGAGDDARIVIADSSGITLVNGNTVTLSTTYTRSVVSYALPVDSASYRIYVVSVTQHNTNILADDIQVEFRKDGQATDFVDPLTPNVDSHWLDTANASMSYRNRPLRKIRGWNLHFSHDTYVSLDRTATSAAGIFILAGTTWSPDWPVEALSRMSFLNATGVETPRVRGVIWGVAY